MIHNAYGILVGKKRNDLRSYVSMIVWEKFLIIYDDSRKVPLDLNDTLWTHFQEMFKLSPKSKTQVFIWMGSSLRNFISKLANKNILSNADKPNLLKLPLIEFKGNKNEDWIVFVKKNFVWWFSGMFKVLVRLKLFML